MDSSAREFGYEDAYQLLRLIEGSPDLRSIELTVGDFSLSLERQPAGEAERTALADALAADRTPAAPATEPAPDAGSNPGPGTGPDAGPDAGPVSGEEEVRSTIAGVFYRSPAPGADPFVTVGSTVTAGETIGIVEVMKLMNTVSAPVAGEVTAILVEDGAAVEFDQPLLRLRLQGTAPTP